MASLAAACIVLAAVGFLAARHPLGTDGATAALVAVLAMAGASAVGAVRWLGPARAASLLVVLAMYAYVIEIVGVTTGVPYGSFAYGAGMGPMMLGIVPASLPAAYVPLVLGAAAVATWAVGSYRAPAVWLLVATAVLVAADVVLDPGAVALGYWAYEGGGSFYGVPYGNFVGWAVTGSVALVLCLAAIRRASAGWSLRGRPAGEPSAPGMPRLRPPGAWAASGMAMTVSFYVGVAAATAMGVPLVFGTVLVAAALVAALRSSR